MLPDAETKVKQTPQAIDHLSGGRESHSRTSDKNLPENLQTPTTGEDLKQEIVAKYKMREVTIKIQTGRTEGDVPIQEKSLQGSSRNTVGTNLKGSSRKNSKVPAKQKVVNKSPPGNEVTCSLKSQEDEKLHRSIPGKTIVMELKEVLKTLTDATQKLKTMKNYSNSEPKRISDPFHEQVIKMNQKIADVARIESNQQSSNELESALKTEKVDG